MGKLTISSWNPNLVLDEFGNEMFLFRGDFYADLLEFVQRYNYYRYSR